MVLFIKTATAQNTYKGLPVIKASSSRANYKTGSQKINHSWNILPQIAADSLSVNCLSGKVPFTFYTGNDSISFLVSPNKSYPFYVQLNDTSKALTVVTEFVPKYDHLTFDTDTENEKIHFLYEQNSNNDYLQKLISLYPIDSLVALKKTIQKRH